MYRARMVKQQTTKCLLVGTESAEMCIAILSTPEQKGRSRPSTMIASPMQQSATAVVSVARGGGKCRMKRCYQVYADDCVLHSHRVLHRQQNIKVCPEFQLMRLRARLESHFLIVGFTRVHTFVTWDSHELTHNLTGSHAQTFVLDWKRHTHKGHTTRQQTATWAHTAGHKRNGHHMCAHLSFVGFTRVHTFVTWDSHELTHNLTGSHAQTFVLDWKRHTHKGHTTRQQTATWAHTAGHKRNGHHMCAHLSFVGFTRVHTFVTWDSHELTHNLTGSHAQTFVLDWKRHTHKGHTTRQQTATWAHTAGHKRNGHHMCAHLSFVGFTRVHTFCLWDAKDSQTQKTGIRIN